eukprot:jgi/Mesen1/1763/ME000014S01169
MTTILSPYLSLQLGVPHTLSSLNTPSRSLHSKTPSTRIPGAKPHALLEATSSHVRRSRQHGALRKSIRTFLSSNISSCHCLMLPAGRADFITRVREQSQVAHTGRTGGALVAVAGLPVVSSVPVLGPLANFLTNPFILLAVYIAGAVRFYNGFRRTTMKDDAATKAAVTAMWPVLFVVSKDFRTNFKKAVQ